MAGLKTQRFQHFRHDGRHRARTGRQTGWTHDVGSRRGLSNQWHVVVDARQPFSVLFGIGAIDPNIFFRRALMKARNEHLARDRPERIANPWCANGTFFDKGLNESFALNHASTTSSSAIASAIGSPVSSAIHPHWPEGLHSKNHHSPSAVTEKSNAP